MASTYDVIERWLDTLEGRTGRNGRPLENLGGSRVYGSGNRLFSYGSHFTLAEWLEGRKRDRPLFLLNGDRFSTSTSRHQSETRGSVARRAVDIGADVILLPFSALAAAGIRHESIRPLEVRPDRWLDEFERIPPGIDLDDRETAARWRDMDEGYTTRGRTYIWPLDDGRKIERFRLLATRPYSGTDSSWRAVDEWQKPTLVGSSGGRLAECTRDASGTWRIHYRRHLLGDSLFTAEVDGTRAVRRECTVRDVVRAAVAQYGRYSRADALIRPLDLLNTAAPVLETVSVRRRRRFVSSFDSNEPRPLYFLATLPSSSRARTVETAIEDLAPRAVHAALAREREVLRQGDIFAIATDLTDADVAALAKSRARLTQWTRAAAPRPDELGGRPKMTAADRRRFSVARKREWRRLWRAVDVRGAIPETSAGARCRFRKLRGEWQESLDRDRDRARRAVLNGNGYAAMRARESVAWRLERGWSDANGSRSRAAARDSYRRGRSLIPQTAALQVWRDATIRTLERFVGPYAAPISSPRWTAYRTALRRHLGIYGTAHSATEVVRAASGAVYIRGHLRHVPELEQGRGGIRDHVPLKLGAGATWYLAIRNTVPRARGTGGR